MIITFSGFHGFSKNVTEWILILVNTFILRLVQEESNDKLDKNEKKRFLQWITMQWIYKR